MSSLFDSYRTLVSTSGKTELQFVEKKGESVFVSKNSLFFWDKSAARRLDGHTH